MDWIKRPYNAEETLWEVWYKDAVVALTGTEEEVDAFIASKQ